MSTLKGVTNKPVAVGFGISKAEHAAQIASWGADGVIVGSALVRALGEAATPGTPRHTHAVSRPHPFKLALLTRTPLPRS